MTRLILPALASCALIVACGKKQEATTTPRSLVSSNPAPLPTHASTAPPTGKFEGDIVVDVKSGSNQKLPSSVTFEVKGDKVRYAPASANVRAVDDLGTQRALVISDSKRAYSEMDTKAPADKAPPQVRLEKSTKEEEVAGLPCEDWKINDGNERADVCVAKDIAFFDPAGDPKPGNAEPSWARALTTQKAFPLRVVVHNRLGKEEYRAEAFEVNWKKIDDSEFQVPAGFKKADLTEDLKMASLP
jgi:hypothetical protein